MRAPRWSVVLLLGCLVVHSRSAVAEAAPRVPPRALVLYDSQAPYGWLGELRATQVASLLGHFPVPWTLRPVEDYVAGQMEEYSVTFYVGAEYDNPLPEAFLSDVMVTERTVCWMGYNLWQIAWDELGWWDPLFSARYGFQFAGVDATGYPEVWYKGVSLVKDVSDPDIGGTIILDAEYAEVLATAYCPDPEASWPYVVHAGNLWYFADVPLSYISEEDRYLAFCDLLHDIVGIDHPVSRRALIRIEDVDATATPSDLEGVANYLHSRHILFQVAVIPRYLDPLGTMGGGSPEEAWLSDSPAVVDALQYMVNRGGEVFQHGLSHQYDATPNPYTGLTADDSEFFLASWSAEEGTQLLGPVPEDSEAWVQDRIDQGRGELLYCDLTPVAWETPHYVASALDETLFGQNYDLCSGRMLYFTAANDYFVGQFFPYPIKWDVYGQRISPENLGNVEPDWFYDYPPRYPEDIVRAAEKNLVIRDAWASAYFHPYYNISYLRDVVEGVEALGYTFGRAPTLVAEAGPDKEISLGEAATLKGSASGGALPYSYSWAPATDLDHPGEAQPSASPSDTTTYMLTVEDHEGRSDHDLMTVTVIWPPPTAEFSASPTSGTAPLSVGFTDLSALATSWSWEFGDGSTSTQQHPSHTFQNYTGSTVAYTVGLTVTNRSGTDTETKADHVSVLPVPPVANFAGIPTSGTAPLEVAFSDMSTGHVTSWSWEFGDGGTATERHPSHSYANSGGTTLTRSVSLTVSNDGGSDTKTRANYITVIPPAPAAGFSATPTMGTAPLAVSFSDTSTNGPTAWNWSFGDGSTSTARHPSHSYSNSGGTTLRRTVSLTVTNDGGSDTETKTEYITVVPPAPVASFSATPTSGTAPLSVSFSDTSTKSPTAWSWSFGDGGTSTAQHPSHTYANNGGTTLRRTVSLTVTNDGGSDTETKTAYIAVVPPAPIAEFSATPTSGTAPLAVTFTDLSSNVPTAWSWSFGDGGASTAQLPSHTYANSGGTTLRRTVSLTVTNDGGSDTETKTEYITVVPPAPTPDFSASPTSGTAPLIVNFTDRSTGNATSWSWEFGDGETSTQQHPSHTYENSGGTTLMRTVSLTAANAGGSDTETKADYVSVVPPAPVAEFSAAPTSGTAPLVVSFTNLSTPNATSWSWDFGDGGTSTAQHPSHTYHNGGGTTRLLTVSLTVTNGGGADTETKVDWLAVSPAPPTADFSATPISGAGPLVVSFTDLSTNAPTSWSWDFGDGGTASAQHPSHSYENDGGMTLVRTVSLTATNDSGSDTETKVDYISVVPRTPEAAFSATPTSGTAPLTVSFADLSSNNPTAWSWDFGDGATSTEQHPSHTYGNDTGTALLQTVSLTASNEGGSDTETKADHISVVPRLPVAEFSAAPVSGTAPLMVSFTDLSAGSATSWSWDFGDGDTSAEQHPAHEYANPRRYSVTLSVANAAGSNSKTKLHHIASLFSDVPSDYWAYGQIMACVDAGIVYGYWDKTYRPDTVVTRDAMAVYVSRALAGGDDLVTAGPAAATFSDVPTDHWAFRYVEYAHAHEVVAGYWDGTYRPGLEVDRAAMAIYVARAMSGGEENVPEDPDGTPFFPDVPTGHWAYKYVEYCHDQGVIGGYWDGSYRPDEVVNRAAMAVYVQRAFELSM